MGLQNHTQFIDITLLRAWSTTLLSTLISVSLGFIIGRLNKRIRDSKIAYSKSYQTVSANVPIELRSHVKLLYKDQEIDGLTTIAFEFENVGTTLLSEQTIRFQLPPANKILDFRLHGNTPELKAEITSDGQDTSQPIITIGHFDRDQKFGAKITLTGASNVPVSVFPSNEKESVELIERSKNIAADEQKQLSKFFFIGILYLLLVSTESYLPFISQMKIALALPNTLLALYLVKLAYPACKLIATGWVSSSAVWANGLVAQRDLRIRTSSTRNVRGAHGNIERKTTLISDESRTLRSVSAIANESLRDSVVTAMDSYINLSNIPQDQIMKRFAEIREFTRKEVDGNGHFDTIEGFDMFFADIFRSRYSPK